MSNFNFGEKVVATYGYNSVLKKPFEFIYDFGYYTRDMTVGVVYICGCCNMQDSYAFKIEQLRKATEEDLETISEGM